MPGRWPLFLFALWAAGAVGMGARVLRGLVYVRRLKRASRPLPARYQCRLRALRRPSSGPRRWVRLCSSGAVSTPTAVGLLDPAILIPEALPGRLTEAEFDGRADVATVIADPPDRQALDAPFRGLFERVIRTPQQERLFWVRFEHAGDFDALRRRNVVIAAPLDRAHAAGDLVRSFLGPEQRATIRKGAPAVAVRQDVWARDQVVVLVTGADREALVENLMVEAGRVYRGADHNRFGADYCDSGAGGAQRLPGKDRRDCRGDAGERHPGGG